MKKVLLLTIILSTISLPSLANQVLLTPNYEDPRFAPSDKFHAGCNNTFDVILESVEAIKNVNLILQYNPDEIEIIRLIPDTSSPEENFEQKVEYGKIDFSKSNQNNLLKNKKLFKIEFKSNADITWTLLSLLNWSNIMTNTNEKVWLTKTFELQFAKVSECQPDIMPPSVKLIQPRNTADELPLDAYFVFDVKDNDKWVDKKNVTIVFDWKVYDSGSDSIRRSGTNLVFFPENWLEIDKDLDLKLTVQDKQSYGWPNTTEKIFSFKTASWVLFKSYIEPSKFRSLVYQTNENKWWFVDCDLIKKLYIKSDSSLKPTFKSIINKLNCGLPTSEETDQYLKASLLNQKDTQISKSLKNIKPENKNTFISVFAAIWRILFIVTLILKIHYLVAYHVQKKKHKEYIELIENK